MAQNSRDRHLLNALGVILFLAMLGAMAFATLTRPIPREHITHKIKDLRPGLGALHKGEGPCVRWSTSPPLSEQEIRAFLDDLGRTLTPDLHTLLPLMAQLRIANRARAAQRHGTAPREEVIAVAFGRLSRLDKMRFDLSGQAPEELLPMLTGFAQPDPRHALDEMRAARMMGWLEPDEARAIGALIERWRERLVGRDAQVSVIDAVAAKITKERIRALERALEHHLSVFGRYPRGLAELIGFTIRIERLEPTLARGIERDKTLRDGWLRPFEYYTVGPRQFRLISEGPSDNMDEDNLTAP